MLFQEALARQDLDDWRGAESCYRRLLSAPKSNFFSSCDPGLRSYKAHHNLAVVLRELNNSESACEEWKKAVALCDSFVPSLKGLGEHYLARNDWVGFSDIIRRLRAVPAGRLTADVLEARCDMARSEWSAARSKLESLIAMHPRDSSPRQFLSHLFLRTEDWVNAEEFCAETFWKLSQTIRKLERTWVY